MTHKRMSLENVAVSPLCITAIHRKQLKLIFISRFGLNYRLTHASVICLPSASFDVLKVMTNCQRQRYLFIKHNEQYFFAALKLSEMKKSRSLSAVSEQYQYIYITINLTVYE